MVESLDERVHALLAASKIEQATTVTLRELGPEVFGFLAGVLGDSDADEVFSGLSVRLWKSLDGFEGRCTLRTWIYVLARHELGKFRKSQKRYAEGYVPISELQDVLAVVRTTRSTDARGKLSRLRDELPVDDRMLLILRVDRSLAWDDIALAFADNPESFRDDDKKREAARLRKRFQLIKDRLVARLRGAPLGL
jgi:RNA polymerase sigma-70 factor (ECF subfamily)